ncbi:hypothetical protein M222_0733 [Enterococcus faecalis AZ19]|nr:hypothetical protein M222_0733 [Enterococcus faecalis AZ19]
MIVWELLQVFFHVTLLLMLDGEKKIKLLDTKKPLQRTEIDE